MSTATRDVARMLASYSRRAWETLAKSRGLDPQKLRGPALQNELSRVLLAPTALKNALAMTTPDEQLTLARLKLDGGKAPAAELKAQLLVDGVSDPDAAFRSLMAAGLLFYDRSMEGYGRWELKGQEAANATGYQPPVPPFWLPPEIDKLVDVPPDLGRLPLQSAPDPIETREASFAALQRDIYLLLQAVRENPVKLLKSGDVAKRDSERLVKVLPKAGAGENDPTAKARADGSWFHFIWLLIQRAELIYEETGRLTVSPAGTEFLGQSEAHQAQRLVRAWANMGEWDEFRRVPTFEFDLGAWGDFPSPPQIIMGRLLLMELLLREQPYPGWFNFPSLLASMRRFHVAFLIPRSDMMAYTPWGMRGAKEDRHYRGFHERGSAPHRAFDKDKDWDEVEGAFLRTVFEEPLVWLGIVRLGYANGALVSFELTERGAAAIGLIEMPAAQRRAMPEAGQPGQRALVVQPNFEVVVYPEIAGISLLVELDRFAERVRMDRAALYRLTRADLCRGLQSGLTLEDITRRLEVCNAGPLPQNVAYSLEEWERLYNRIHVHRSVSLIEAADDAELRAFRALPELKNAREVAPRVLLVSPGASLRNLRSKPELIDYTLPITDAIEFETTTRLCVLRPTPRLIHRLNQIAEPTADGIQHGDTETRRGESKGKRGKQAAKDTATSSQSASSSVASSSVSPCLRVENALYELSQEKVARAARWWKGDAMHGFLSSAAKTKPKPELAVILKGWAGDLAPAAVTAMTLLAAPSAEWLDQVLLVPEVKRFILHRLSPTLALVLEENRARLEEALRAIGISTGVEVSPVNLLMAESKAATDAGEIMLMGPPRKRRALIEQAIAEKKRLTIATLPYGGKLNQTKLDPVRIEGEGASASLIARMEGTRYEYSYSLNQIKGVRMLDEPSKT